MPLSGGWPRAGCDHPHKSNHRVTKSQRRTGFSSAGGLPKAAHGRTQRSAKTRRSLNPARFVFADRCVRPRRVAPPAELDGLQVGALARLASPLQKTVTSVPPWLGAGCWPAAP